MGSTFRKVFGRLSMQIEKGISLKNRAFGMEIGVILNLKLYLAYKKAFFGDRTKH